VVLNKYLITITQGACTGKDAGCCTENIPLLADFQGICWQAVILGL